MVKCSLELDLTRYIGATMADTDGMTVSDTDTQI